MKTRPIILFLPVAIIALLSSCGFSSMDKKFYWDNGNLKKEGHVTNGKAEGIWNYYYETGEKKSETTFKNDVKHGRTIHYWLNGRKKGQGVYIDGVLDCRWVAWFENGQKEREGELVQGKETGQWQIWDSLGREAGKYYYIGGTLNGWSTLTDPSGAKEARFYIDGIVKSYTRYSPDGVVIQSEVLMRRNELPPLDKELVVFLAQDSILKPHTDYAFEMLVPGVPFECISVSVTNASVRKGPLEEQYLLNANGTGDACIRLYFDLSNGERVELGPECFPVSRK